MTKYLIIGGSVGAVGAVESIKKIDPSADLTIISDEAKQSYSRPMISDYLSGEAELKKMAFPSEDFWEKNNVSVRLGKKVVKLDLAQKAVEFEDAEQLKFDKLLIATGGKPFIPKMEGMNRKGIYSFTTIAEAENIEKDVGSSRNAVVIGGGLIGVSVSEALVRRSLNVTVIELKGWLLNLVLDKEAARIVEAAMQKKGVSIKTNRTVKTILGRKGNDSAVGGVILDDGTLVDCDMIIAAIGVIPRTELAAQSGLKVNRGILVDRCMRTNVPDVYACGDVAEAYDFILKSDRVLALWPVARIGGQTAGSNMAGQFAEYPGGTTMSALNYFGVPIISVGLTTLEKQEGYETLVSAPAEGVYKKIVLKENIIVGVTFVGDVEGAGIIVDLMKKQVDVEKFKEKLLSEAFSLASLPRSLISKYFEA